MLLYGAALRPSEPPSLRVQRLDSGLSYRIVRPQRLATEERMTDGDLVPQRIPAADAERLLARAAALDVQHRTETVDVSALRQAALAAGIDAAAFEAALREETTPAPAPAPVPPWIVRVTLLGVPNRGVAWGYYAFFTLALFAAVVAAVLAPVVAPQHVAGYAPLLALLAAWAVFAPWSTSKAIRWADAHGWDRLP